MRSNRRRLVWLIIGLLLIAIAIWLQSFVGAAVIMLVTLLRGLR